MPWIENFFLYLLVYKQFFSSYSLWVPQSSYDTHLHPIFSTLEAAPETHKPTINYPIDVKIWGYT